MTKHPIRAFLRAIGTSGFLRAYYDDSDLDVSPKPASADHDSKPEPTPEPELPDEIRKGVVLRRSEYTRQTIASYNTGFFQQGGPRIVLAVSIDDEKGKEVITVDQALEGEVSLVAEGNSVKVTRSRYAGFGLDSVLVSLDWDEWLGKN